MSRNRVKPIEQIYDHYTKEDFSVWKLLYETQISSLDGIVAEEFLKGLVILDFNSKKIPDFKKVNEKLDIISGWSIKTVPNMAQPKEFFTYLANKNFTSTCWLRSMEEIDYLEEPDMFHDIFGHIPLLLNPVFSEFVHAFGKLGKKHIQHKEFILKMQRLYWYTIEFGLIKQDNELKIFGAGIVSSFGESNSIHDKKIEKIEYDIEKVMATSFYTDAIQDKYFVANSMDELYESLHFLS